MLNKVNDINVVTYNVLDDYYVDIVTKDDEYESWIYSDRYGIKMLMFGVPKDQQPYSIFLEIVEANLIEYLNDYIREVEDEPFVQDNLREMYNKFGINDEELDKLFGESEMIIWKITV